MTGARPIVRAALLGVLALAATLVGYGVWRNTTGAPPEVRRLADGTSASLAADTRLLTAQGFPSRREISLDGEALLEVPAAGQPLIVRTRLMRLEVRGPSLLAITAWSRETGEQVEVSSGKVIVSKNYPSSYRVPDELHGGEMSMVNETIDLMEKEHVDTSALAEMREHAKRLGWR